VATASSIPSYHNFRLQFQVRGYDMLTSFIAEVRYQHPDKLPSNE